MSCEWIGFCSLSSEAQAAWAQAILTVLTFVVATVMTIRASKKSQRDLDSERLRQAKREAAAELRRAKALGIQALSPLHDALDAVALVLMSANATGNLDLHRAKSAVEMSPRLRELTLATHEFGPATESVQLALMNMEMVNDMANAAIKLLRRQDGAIDQVVIDQLKHALELTEGSCRNAVDSIKAMFASLAHR